MTTTRNSSIGILIADDSREFLAAASAWVENHPPTSLLGTAGNGVDAVAAVARCAPDLILMDAFMPDMDGFQATREIKSRPGAPMIVIVSVSDGAAIEDEARAAGADAFLPKSEFAARLPGLLRDLLGEPRPAFASADAGPARASMAQETT